MVLLQCARAVQTEMVNVFSINMWRCNRTESLRSPSGAGASAGIFCFVMQNKKPIYIYIFFFIVVGELHQTDA